MTVFDEVRYLCDEMQRLNSIGEGNWSIDDYYYFDHMLETMTVLQRLLLDEVVYD